MGDDTPTEGEKEPELGGSSPDAGAGPPTLPLDLAFEILKNERRRLVLEELSRAEGPMSTGELSDVITARENDKSVSEITSQERKRVYVGLYQCHLPKMDDAGVIHFDKDRGTIERGEHADLLERYLAAGERTTIEGTTVAAPSTDGAPSGRYWATAALILGALLVLCTVVETVGGISTDTLALVGLLGVTGGQAVRHAIADGG